MEAVPEERAGRDDLAPSPAEAFALLRRYPLLVLGTAVLALFVALLLLGTRVPRWSAEATLVVGGETSREGPLNPFHVLREPPRVAGELAFLSSRAPAEATAADLGLEALADDEELRPLPSLLRRLVGAELPPARLVVRAGTPEADAPREVRVRFVEPGAVEVSRTGFLGRSVGTAEFLWHPGLVLDYHGLRLSLEPAGEVLDRSFLVTLRDPEEAVRTLLENTRAEETEPGSGVVRLVHEDSDATRCAEVANALCTNYLELRRAERVERSHERLERVEDELVRVRAELEGAQDELARLQHERPLSVDREESAKFLLLSLTELEASLAGARLERSLVGEAVERLELGAVDALSRVAESTADTSTRILIEHVAQLEAQAQLQERSDSGAYRHVVQNQLLKLSAERASLERELDALEAALVSLREEGAGAAGRLGGQGPAALAVDPVTTILLERVARLSAELDELLAGDHMPEHPRVEKNLAAIEEHLARIESQLEGRVAGLRRQLERHDEFLAETETLLAEHPLRERREIEAALGRLRENLLGHLRGLHASLVERERSRSDEVERLRRELAALPASARAQLEPLARVEGFRRRLAELLAAREAAKLAAALAEPPGRLVRPAAIPTRRDSPRLTTALCFALVAGLGLGFAGVLLLDRSRGSVATPAELAAACGAPAFGSLPELGLETREAEIDAVEHALALEPDGALARALRGVRARLAQGFAGRTLGVCSATGGEGDEALALGIALTCAHAGRRVLHVRADPRAARPAALAFEGEMPAGFVESLSGAGEWRTLVRPTGTPGAEHLDCGRVEEPLSDLFLAPPGAALLADWNEVYDLVVVHLPPVEEGAEAVSLGARLDGVVLACRGRGASRARVRRAAAELAQGGVVLHGAVLIEPVRLTRRSESLRLLSPPTVVRGVGRAA